jgi:ubiquitin carboxyl-terminal hydrolase 34
VRQGAHALICELYQSSEGWPPEIIQVKWKTLRDTVEDMINRIIYEKDAGMLRSHLTPLIATCQFLLRQIFDLTQSEDPEMNQYKDDVNDTARIYQWRTEIEPRLLTWPQDDGLSTGDLYDQSDFGSESDVEELLDIET